MHEIQTTSERIRAAMQVIPGYKLREIVVGLLQINPRDQSWLVYEWKRQYDDLDTEYEGDPHAGDPHALVAFMHRKSTITLRLLACRMAGNTARNREWLKQRLLITGEDGTLDIRQFEPCPGSRN